MQKSCMSVGISTSLTTTDGMLFELVFICFGNVFVMRRWKIGCAFDLLVTKKKVLALKKMGVGRLDDHEHVYCGRMDYKISRYFPGFITHKILQQC